MRARIFGSIHLFKSGVNDLAHRHTLRGSFKEPRDLERHLTVVEQKKQVLTQYASLSTKPGPQLSIDDQRKLSKTAFNDLE
jgi:hypothetical protein